MYQSNEQPIMGHVVASCTVVLLPGVKKRKNQRNKKKELYAASKLLAKTTIML